MLTLNSPLERGWDGGFWPTAAAGFCGAPVTAGQETRRRKLTRNRRTRPRCTGSFRRIVQTPGGISIFYDVGQGQGWQRNIVMNGSSHLPANIRQWFGDSRGHWEGDTLVIDTTNF